MNFTSGLFLILFPITVFLYRRLTPERRSVLLLLSSLLLFLLGSPFSFCILMTVTLVSFLAARALAGADCGSENAIPGAEHGSEKAISGAEHGSENAIPGAKRASGKDIQKKRWRILLLCVVFCLGLLTIFKAVPGLPMPAGISFYTFQALSLCIDVYRGEFVFPNSLSTHALYLSFFPQVVAGPIERPKDLIPQLKAVRTAAKVPGRTSGITSEITSGRMTKDIQNSAVNNRNTGGFLLLRGYVKKCVIADTIAPVSDVLFANWESLSGPKVLAAAVLFAFQIYADFSGYSDIALGAAGLLGIRLTPNFETPYLSGSLREFWRRWHITLTRWLRDYVYIPLGGSRGGKIKTIRNTLLVFSLSGLWHGFSPHFVLWGFLNGVLVLLSPKSPQKGKQNSKGFALLSVVLTFLVVSLLWIFFRAPSIHAALGMLQALPFGWQNALRTLLTFAKGDPVTMVLILLAPLLLALLRRTPTDEPDSPYVPIKRLVAGYLLFLLILFCRMKQLSAGVDQSFLYFAF